MKRLKQGTISLLDFEQAAVAEAASLNALIPPAPGWDDLAQNAPSVARWLSAELRSGFQPSQQLVIGARKAQHGVRPFAVWGVPERVLYRALVDRILHDHPPIDRSHSAYQEFVRGPILAALDNESLRRRSRLTASDASIKYVLKSDVTAFYQYIDHEVLAGELSLATTDFDLIDVLLELIAEVQGRKFGLPQGFSASDRLSDVYIDLVERSMIRQGVAVWRYNDDFRIATSSYSSVLDAIERLDASCREIGLVLNDHKTVTPGFATYVHEVLELDADEPLAPHLVTTLSEVELDDYSDASLVSAEDALAEISRVKLLKNRTSRNDIRGLDPERLRSLRRAWESLAYLSDPSGIQHAPRFFSYARSLTPSLVKYLSSVAVERPDEVSEAISLVIRRSLSDWQRGWLIHLIGELYDGEDIDSTQARTLHIRWLRRWSRDRSRPVLQAQATIALARGGEIDFDLIDDALRAAPGALENWYVEAARSLVEHDGSLSERFRALVTTTTSTRWLTQWE